MTDYADYLAQIHAQLLTPTELILETVKEATGQTSNANPQKITAGEVNEVYFVSLPDGKEVAVRISRTDDFASEKWAIEKCEELGVPVAKILLIKQAELEHEKVNLCVQSKLPGEPLERGKIDFHTLDKKYLQRILNKAGELLSRIHSIPTEGFGHLNGQGQGEYFNFYDFVTEFDEQERYSRLARETNFPEEEMKKLLDALTAGGNKYRDLKPFLSHGDFNVKHIMFEGGEITGILDFGDVEGHSPVNDFAKWDYWFGDDPPLEWIKEGYANKKLFNSDFDELMLLIQLRNGTHILKWYNGKYPNGVEGAKQKLHELLDKI